MGSLRIEKKDNEDYYVIDADFETKLMIERLIPSNISFLAKIGDDYQSDVGVRVHPENTKILRMIMSEYPLEIKTEKWKANQDEISKKLERAKLVSKLELKMPDSGHFVGELRDFQKEGLDFLLKLDGKGMITDEMGLGKTVQTIAYISHNARDLPVIIVAPLVTLVNWKRELEKFLRVDFVDFGSQKRLDSKYKGHIPIINMIRDGQPKALPFTDITLVNYELVRPRLKDLINLEAKTIVFDEIHSLRNDSTGKYGACRELGLSKSVKHRIGLSGTPIYNKGVEMYNICEMIQPGLLGERSEYIRRYCNYYGGTKEDAKESLYKILRESVMIRRKKMDVLKDLKDKVKMKQPIQVDTELYENKMSELMEEIQEAKDRLAGMTIEDEKKEGLFSLNKTIQSMTTSERQIAGLAKAPYVIEYIRTLLEDYEEEKFVVFCHHIAVHEMIYKGLYRFNPVQIIGGQSDKERQYAIDSFQDEKGRNRVIICGIRAGSVGINLTNASYVIFAELDWSPSVHLQAEDRLHRIGQENIVFSHYLVGEGTFDEFISQKLLDKSVIINDILGDKMEVLDNKKALEYLESRFTISKMNKNNKILTDLTKTI